MLFEEERDAVLGAMAGAEHQHVAIPVPDGLEDGLPHLLRPRADPGVHRLLVLLEIGLALLLLAELLRLLLDLGEEVGELAGRGEDAQRRRGGVVGHDVAHAAAPGLRRRDAPFVEVEPLASGDDGRQQRLRLVGDEQEERALPGLLERLEEGVRRIVVEPVGEEDDGDLPASHVGAHLLPVQQLVADDVDADDARLLLGFDPEGVNVFARQGIEAGVAFAAGALRVVGAEEEGGNRLGDREPVAPRRPADDVGMGHPAVLVTLLDDLEYFRWFHSAPSRPVTGAILAQSPLRPQQDPTTQQPDAKT